MSQSNASYIDLSRNSACETSIQLGQLRGLGRHECRQRQASSGSLRLPRCSPRGRVGFKPTAEFGWRHCPSWCCLCSFTLALGAERNVLSVEMLKLAPQERVQ